MHSNIIEINGKDIDVKEYSSKRVVTFKDIDEVHERSEGTARKRFNDNKKHFINGEDYFKVCASEIRTNKILDIPSKAHQDIVLITESGYLMLVKSFTDELAWKVQRQLVNCYFRMAEHPQPVNQLQNLSPQLQALINMELKQKEQDAKIAALTDKTQKQEETLKTIHDTLFRDASDFRRWVVRCVGNIAISPSFDGTYNKYQKAWLESYDRLNEKVKCDLLKMVDEAKAKAKAEGATKSQIKNINRQSIIAENPGLREAYRLVIKEMLIAYCVEVA